MENSYNYNIQINVNINIILRNTVELAQKRKENKKKRMVISTCHTAAPGRSWGGEI